MRARVLGVRGKACWCEHLCVSNWLTRTLKVHPEEAWGPRGPSSPCLRPGSGWGWHRHGNSRPEEARLLREPETVWPQDLFSSPWKRLTGSVWDQACAPSEWGGLASGRFQSSDLHTHLGRYGCVTSLSSTLIWVSPPYVDKVARPTGFTLTDFENAIQVTARSKNPIPMTCSVFNVTESQMRTCGGNCCFGRKCWVTHRAESTNLPLYWSYFNFVKSLFLMLFSPQFFVLSFYFVRLYFKSVWYLHAKYWK